MKGTDYVVTNATAAEKSPRMTVHFDGGGRVVGLIVRESDRPAFEQTFAKWSDETDPGWRERVAIKYVTDEEFERAASAPASESLSTA